MFLMQKYKAGIDLLKLNSGSYEYHDGLLLLSIQLGLTFGNSVNQISPNLPSLHYFF